MVFETTSDISIDKIRTRQQQNRKEKSFEICEKALGLNDSKQQVIEFKKAIEYNPTNALAWFNLGVAQDKEQNFEEAFFNFLSAGLFQDRDKEAQFNALTISFTQGQYELFNIVLYFIVEKHGELVLNDLSDYFMNKPIPFDMKRQIIDGITMIVKEMKMAHDEAIE